MRTVQMSEEKFSIELWIGEAFLDSCKAIVEEKLDDDEFKFTENVVKYSLEYFRNKRER